MPVLFTHQTTAEHVVPVAGHQRAQALAAHETLEVEDVRWRWVGRGCAAAAVVRAASAAHHELTGRDCLAAGRTSAGVAEQPAGPLR